MFFRTDRENFHGMILLWSRCIVGTGRVSYLASLNVSGVLVRPAALAGTRRAGSWETQTGFLFIFGFCLKKKILEKKKGKNGDT